MYLFSKGIPDGYNHESLIARGYEKIGHILTKESIESQSKAVEEGMKLFNLDHDTHMVTAAKPKNESSGWILYAQERAYPISSTAN